MGDIGGATQNGKLAQTDMSEVRASEKYDTPYWTNNVGVPIANNLDSLSVGRRGPLLLEDYHLVEKLAQFDRERIPERVVHARGAGAKGYFEVTHDITHLTFADLFREVGARTPVTARFSTVIHERGSPETLRDVRGFSVKFYTREGNWDFVGNNIPVFFIRDGIDFPDLIHAFKPNPVNNQQEFWRIFDYLSHHPESLNIQTYLMDDDGIPKDYRHMPGFSVNTFKLINKEDKETYVKFIWTPKEGIVNLLDDEAAEVQAQNDRHATADLFEAIENKNYPEYELSIQTMDPADEDKFEFDPLDDTKIWPEDRFPPQPVGKMVLDQNLDNFFNENEVLAFNPGIVVPGIYYSNDKMLQSRIFSYSDSQRHRLGPNYLLLPVNRPKCQYHNNHYDSVMNTTYRKNEVNYFPSDISKVAQAKPWTIAQEELHGHRTKQVIPKENNFQQPGDRFRSWPKDRQERFITRVVGKLAGPKVPLELRKGVVDTWTQVDENLGA